MDENVKTESKIDWDKETSEALLNFKTRHRGDGKSTEPKTKPKTKAETASLEKELDEMLSPANLKMYLRAPADLMLVRTGNAERWDIPDKEMDPLCVSGSMVAKKFVHIDPKWLSLIIFSGTVFAVYGTRFIAQMQEYRKEEHKRTMERMEAEKKQNHSPFGVKDGIKT